MEIRYGGLAILTKVSSDNKGDLTMASYQYSMVFKVHYHF